MPTTRFSLIERLSDPADATAWSEFLDLYQDAIRRFARGRGLQEADAADVVQEVMLLVHKRIGEWRPSGRAGAFRSWLLKTAHYVCLRALHAANRLDRAVGGSSAHDEIHRIATRLQADSEPDWQEWAFCWAAGIVERQVERKHWQAFLMSGVEGLPAAEVARRLEISAGSVYLAKCRVLARIRSLIGELTEDER